VYVRRVHSRPEAIRRLVELGLKAGEMTDEYLQVLLATAEEMLATASALPESAGRDDAVQMVRAYVSNIALLMNAVELGLKAKK
jgi:hypothetical protein